MTSEGLTLLRTALLDSGRVVLDLRSTSEERSQDIALLVAEGLLAPLIDEMDGDPARLVYSVTEKGRAAVRWQTGN